MLRYKGKVNAVLGESHAAPYPSALYITDNLFIEMYENIN